ncbi:GNAT family N-acetyltransferase [Streptomyces bacillaris]|uniref:GNAT family N-acetyltransferase n=1 Tax=Streptomyces bacillaris TaxID=68179 RepID=UPI003816AF44
MTRALSTPPVIPHGSLGGSPQPERGTPGGLEIRPWEDGDAPDFLAAYRDDEIRRWHTRRPSTETQVHGWFAACRRDWQREKGAHWAVARGGGSVLGRIALRGFDFDDGVADVAYWVVPGARGTGVASGALTVLTTWALREIGFHRLELDHSTRNAASCGVVTKCGYLLEGTKRSAAVHDGGRHDMHLHARVRDEGPVRSVMEGSLAGRTA